MDLLRWILLGVGVVVLVGIYFAGRMRAARRPRDLMDQVLDNEDLEQIHIRADEGRREPELRGLDEELHGLRGLVQEEAQDRPIPVQPPPVRRRPPPAPAARPVKEMKPQAPTPASPPVEEKILVLHVAAPVPERFLGVDLSAALADQGLEFGDMQIYHRMVESDGKRVPLFSVANMVNPGVLDPETMHDFTTPGVSLFLRLPGPWDGVKAFDTMLACAEALADRLGGSVLDASRSASTRQGNDHIREEIRIWQLKARLRQGR